MAGGNSGRMRAEGCQTHKALRTVGGSPLIEHNLRKLFSSEFRDVSVAVSKSEEDLRAWLAGPGLDCAVDYRARLRILTEDKPLGTIGAARQMIDMAEDLLVLNADNLTDLDLHAFFDFHLKAGAALTVASHREPFRIPFGQLETDGARVTGYQEKPVFPVLVSSGCYILNRRAMYFIPPDTQMQAPDLINLLIDSAEMVVCFHHQSWWVDVNNEAALALAEAAFARKPLLAAAAHA